METKVLNTINNFKIQKNDCDVRVIEQDALQIKRIEDNVVKVVDNGNIIIKTNNIGPQGPRGETGSINDFQLESLAQLFRENL